MNRDQVIQLCEDAAPFADDLVAVAERIELNTPARQAAFLAQLAHESTAFTAIVENLNYGKASLRSLFGKYFPDDKIAAEYARKPEWIANRIYANRMGNGPEASGDGWRYRGRGLIQVTGRHNYEECSAWMFGDDRLLREPELLEQFRFACESAGWFWSSRNLNRQADAGDFEALTRRINGALTGIEDRRAWLEKARTALAATA